MAKEFSCVSVINGWQSALNGNPFGPVFNSVNDLWDWQADNLKSTKVVFVSVPTGYQQQIVSNDQLHPFGPTFETIHDVYMWQGETFGKKIVW